MLRAAAAALVLCALAPSARADGVAMQLELPTRSLFEAQAIGPGSLRFAIAAGFPYVQAVAGLGMTRDLDLNLNVDTLYGAATQLGIGPKLRVAGNRDTTFALSLQAQWTGFRNPAFDETSTGSRHITGLRNWGLEPSAIVSTRGHSGVVFAVARFQLTDATEPELSGPLGGFAGEGLGANAGAYVGGELNSGNAMLHAYGELGVDFHFRSTDSLALPRVELGFTFPG